MSCLASVRFELYSLSPDEADELTFWVLNSQRIISKDYSLALISACLVMIWGQVLRGFKLRSLSIFNLGPKGRVWPLDGAKLTTLPAHARRPRGSRECTYFGGSSSGDPHTAAAAAWSEQTQWCLRVFRGGWFKYSAHVWRSLLFYANQRSAPQEPSVLNRGGHRRATTGPRGNTSGCQGSSWATSPW